MGKEIFGITKRSDKFSLTPGFSQVYDIRETTSRFNGFLHYEKTVKTVLKVVSSRTPG